MCYEKRLEKAIKLIKLTRAGKAFPLVDKLPRSLLVNAEGLENFFTTSESNSYRLQAELRAKYMSDEQLDALLQFYESRIGTAILHAQERISREFSKEYHALLQRDSTKSELGSNSLTLEVRSSITTSAATSGDVPTCSFCEQRHADINKLVAGPGVFICSKCIHICYEILKEDRGRITS